MEQRRVRKVPKEVAMKPAAWDPETDSFIPLGQVISLKGGMRWLDELEGETARKLVIERLRSEPEDTEVGVIQGYSYKRDELIKEVIDGTPIGERFVRIEKAGIARIHSKIAKGEYELDLT